MELRRDLVDHPHGETQIAEAYWLLRQEANKQLVQRRSRSDALHINSFATSAQSADSDNKMRSTLRVSTARRRSGVGLACELSAKGGRCQADNAEHSLFKNMGTPVSGMNFITKYYD